MQDPSRRNYPAAPEPNGELLDLRAARKRYGVSTWTIYRLAKEKLVHAVRPHGRILYPAWELDALIETSLAGSRVNGPPALAPAARAATSQGPLALVA